MSVDLSRFLAAQAEGVYEGALAELTFGHKVRHWMWFIFPQLKGLGQSDKAHFYGLADLAEAAAYLAHPVLGTRLVACTEAMLDIDSPLLARTRLSCHKGRPEFTSKATKSPLLKGTTAMPRVLTAGAAPPSNAADSLTASKFQANNPSLAVKVVNRLSTGTVKTLSKATMGGARKGPDTGCRQRILPLSA